MYDSANLSPSAYVGLLLCDWLGVVFALVTFVAVGALMAWYRAAIRIRGGIVLALSGGKRNWHRNQVVEGVVASSSAL